MNLLKWIKSAKNKSKAEEARKELVRLEEKELQDELGTLIESLANPGVDKPILHVMIGDRSTRWIPNNAHNLAMIKQIKARKLDKKFNVIVSYYANSLVVYK